ncbi:MAG: hypothetical protein K0S39_4880, partial [Paenibacillus sp.]|nr:hypothetical protein [Paenibacillus sp.]
AVNQLLGTSAASFTALKDASINIAKVPAADVSEYTKLASATYFKTVKKVINKYDTNHLFLGVSVVPTWRTNLDWDSAAMEFVDAFSVDNYTNDASWISRYEAFGKPLLNLEYTFSTTQRGLSPVNTATTVASTADRGYAFKSFVESQVSHPLFVGSGWFSYYDQAVTWRKDGENFNIGLLNQQDQPYTEMVNIMKNVNAGLEQVHGNPDNSQGSGTTATLTPAQPDGQNGWYVNPVTLTLSASNNTTSGLKTEYSLDGGVTWQLYSSPVTFDQDGKYTVKYHSLDQTGNEEAIKTVSFMVNKAAPTSVATVSPAAPDGSNGWYKSDVTVSLAVYDHLSGVAKTVYRVNDGGWIDYTGSIPAFGEGNYKIDYRSLDQAGNVEPIRTVEFKIDKTAPLLTVQLDKTSIWPADHKMVDIHATLHSGDAASGVESVVLTSVTSNEPDSGQGDIGANFGTAETLIRLRAERSGNGSGRVYTITYTVTDNAGHKKDASATVTVPHDRGAME